MDFTEAHLKRFCTGGICKSIVASLLIVSAIISPSVSFARVDNIPMLMPQISSVTADRSDLTLDQVLPIPTIQSAFDGFNTKINPGGSTTSDSITFVFFVPVPADNQFTFQCSLDGPLQISLERCNGSNSIQGNNLFGSQSYTGLPLGTYTFHVRVQQLNNNAFSNDATFGWNIISSSNVNQGQIANRLLAGQISNPQSNEVPDSLDTALQASSNAQVSNALAQRSENTQSQVNEVQAQAINPPFKECTNQADLAVYDIKGKANLRDILDSSSGGISPSGEQSDGRLPISLIIYNDQKLGDLNNIIINNNQPMLKGVLVIFPGNIEKQESTNFQINKISTDCKRISLIDKPEQLGGPSPGTQKPSIVKVAGQQPPFDSCSTPPGQGGSQPKVEEDQVTDIVSKGTVIATEAQNDARANNQPLSLQSQVKAQALASPPTPQTLAVLTGGNDPADYAKYTIRGTIDESDISTTGDKQNVDIKIFNNFDGGNNPTGPPEQTVKVRDSNNQFAALMQIDPGTSSDWTVVNYVLHELSTECKVIPFVDRPMQIGVDSGDFRTQPTDDDDYTF